MKTFALNEPFLSDSTTTFGKTERADLDLAFRTSCRNGCEAVWLTHVCVGGSSQPGACQPTLGSTVQQRSEVTPTSYLVILAFLMVMDSSAGCGRLQRPVDQVLSS